MVRHASGTPPAGARVSTLLLTSATIAVAAAGVLAPRATANAATPRPAVPGWFTEDGGGGGGTGTGSAANAAGGSPIQQVANTINGTHAFQSSSCNQEIGVCDQLQTAEIQWQSPETPTS